MLQLSKDLINRPVLSLRTSATIATATQPVINPNNLKIEGWYCNDRFSRKILILQSNDIRDILPQGIVVNDHESLSDPEELIRLHDTLELHFSVLDKAVVTEHKRKLGKVNDYAVDMQSMFIQKLYVTQSVFKSLSGDQLSIDRSQVIEINNKRIIVSEPVVKAGDRAVAPLPVA